MKKQRILALAMALCMALTACGSQSADQESHIGSDTVGYITVPADWKDVGYQGDAPEGYLYSNADSSVDITMDTMSIGVLGDGLPLQDRADIASEITFSDLTALGASEVTSSAGDMAGCPGYRLTGSLTDGTIYCWVFADSNGVLHRITAKGDQDEIQKAVDYVQSTFVLQRAE